MYKVILVESNYKLNYRCLHMNMLIILKVYEIKNLD